MATQVEEGSAAAAVAGSLAVEAAAVHIEKLVVSLMEVVGEEVMVVELTDLTTGGSEAAIFECPTIFCISNRGIKLILFKPISIHVLTYAFSFE